MSTICKPCAKLRPEGTPNNASLLVQIGELGAVEFLEACHFCAGRYDTAYKRKFSTGAPTLPVLICNLAKVDHFAKAGRNNGAGLVKRGNDTIRVCSGPDCVRTDGDKAIAFDGVVRHLCPSCAMASRMAATREPALAKLLNPIDDDLAAVRANRQAETKEVERKRLEKLAKESSEIKAAEAQRTKDQELSDERTALQQSFIDEALTPRVNTRPPRRNPAVIGHVGA